MRLLLLALLASASLQTNALVEKDCERKLIGFSKQFLKKNAQEMFNTNKENLELKFLDFRNTTPGSYYQQYEVVVDVTWPSGLESYSSGTTLTLTLYSPFICDRLELREISEANN